MQAVKIEKDLRAQLLAALAKTALFGALKLERVADAGNLQQFEPGEPLVQEKKPSDSFYMLLQGQAQVMVEQKGQAQQIEIGRMQPPEILGDVGLLLGHARTASVVAADSVLALRFEKAAFQSMFEQIPGFGMAVSRGLAH